MSSEIVGGSLTCLNAIKDGHAVIGELLGTSEGITALEAMFNVCHAGQLNKPLNQEQFAGDGVVSLPVQVRNIHDMHHFATIWKLHCFDTSCVLLWTLIYVHNAPTCRGTTQRVIPRFATYAKFVI
jgi:hypothetical protein